MKEFWMILKILIVYEPNINRIKTYLINLQFEECHPLYFTWYMYFITCNSFMHHNLLCLDEVAGPQPTALPLISQLQQRIPQQRPYFIALTVIFTLFLLIDLITSGGGWTSYVFHSAAAISSAMFNILWDLSAMVVNVLIALIKFPFHFVANLPSYCDSVSNFFHHLFWFVIYAVIVILVVWYCVHTVLITIERREWKLKRKRKKKQ